MLHTHHAIDYVEINVTDLEAAQAFYVEAFGWRFDDYGPAYAGIRSSDGGPEVGGLSAAAPPDLGGEFEGSTIVLEVGHYGVDYVERLGWHR